MRELLIFEIIFFAIIMLFIYWQRNKEKIKSKIEENKLDKSNKSITLTSEKIESTLSSPNLPNNAEAQAAIEYLGAIKEIFNSNSWVIGPQNAVFKSKNRTKDIIILAKGTCDLYVADRLFYTFDFARSNIQAGGAIDIKQNIASEYTNAAGVLSSVAGAISKRLTPQTKGLFRNYEIQIGENHYLYENTYIREVAGEAPIEKQENNFEALIKISKKTEGKSNEYLSAIIASLDKSIKYAKDNFSAEERVWDFINKYIPTIIDSIKSNYLEESEESKKNLLRTLEIMKKAADNFYYKLIESDVDLNEVNQTILEQQLMREGLYSPYDDDFFE